MEIAKQIAEELKIELWQTDAVIKLIDEGNTIPFIARYRKEMHGALDDEQLRNLDERLQYLRNLEDRKATVLASIEEQGKLTPKLREQIMEAPTQVLLEDLYRPFRPKRRTRATIAKEKGLDGLAQLLLAQETERPMEEEAAAYISEEKGVADAAEAIAGAMDIVAESISDEAVYRQYIRMLTQEEGRVISTAKEDGMESVYEMYYDYEEPIGKIAGHRVLALNRGEKEKVLSVKIDAPEERILRYLEKKVIVRENPNTTECLQKTIEDSYKRLIAPAIEREIRGDLTEKAEDGAIRVFGQNLKQLLMQPPIRGKAVLGWDPAFRTGCKLAVVDETGKVLDTTVVYPTEPQNKVEETKETVKKLIDRYGVELISVGNGTASRESEQIIADLIKELHRPVQYIIVNEAGASVYSASKLATEEFPNFDVGQRSAASIARRLQDPLAELVKIDPKSIGVGQYQHDMNQKKLGEQLSAVVEDCVNHVGVDLNTASAPLLEYVSGITKTIAKNIVAYREEHGRFNDRRELLKTPKLGPKAFEQCAGFLRIPDGANPLDATSVHPESYEAARALMETLGWTMEDVIKARTHTGAGTDDGANTSGTEPAAAPEKEAAGRRNQSQRKETAIRQTNTAFGQALLQALGDSSQGVPSEQRGNAKGRRGQSGSARAKAGVGAGSGGNFGGLMAKIHDKQKLAEKLSIGVMTLEDIVKELEKPGRDPRENMPKPILRTDVLEMKDLKEGMILKGTVRNVIDFGAFVDIGVHQDGLVHISQLSGKRFVKHPLDVVSVGDIVTVKVMSVDLKKKRIQLTMKMSD